MGNAYSALTMKFPAGISISHAVKKGDLVPFNRYF